MVSSKCPGRFVRAWGAQAEVASKATLGGDGGASGEAQSRRGGNELVMDSVPIVWRRPSDFYIEGASGAGHGDGASRTAGVDFDVFAGGIEPDDIRQVPLRI